MKKFDVLCSIENEKEHLGEVERSRDLCCNPLFNLTLAEDSEEAIELVKQYILDYISYPWTAEFENDYIVCTNLETGKKFYYCDFEANEIQGDRE